MQIFRNPARAEWAALQQRPQADSNAAVLARAAEIFDDVAQRGDEALRQYATQYDGAPDLTDLRVSPEELAAGAAQVPAELQAAIRQARKNIEAFHAAQRPAEVEAVVETMLGVRCWRRSVAVPRVGLYIPGGSAPLFSTLLMLGVPAKLAGCQEIVLCTPPGRGDGRVAPAILFAAQELGLTTIIKAGGAQAIAALTVGTATVPAVDKIFGPGNRYVTAAKQLAAQRGVAIDMPAGPSEVLVIADASANPAFVAADLLSQAEHGPDSQVVLLTDAEEMLTAVVAELARQLPQLPRAEIARHALAESRAILLPNSAAMLAFSNEYAPEHLILAVAAPETLAAQVINAGSVFMGHLTPEAVGDYASGTNHTLPTGGYARAYSGVSLDSFYKKITFQELVPNGLLALAPIVETMAEAEGLHAHAHAVALRREALTTRPAPAPPSQPASAGVSAQSVKSAVMEELIRPNVRAMKPYSSARDEFQGDAQIMLDANENSLGSAGPAEFNRYPDPHQRAVKQALAPLKNVTPAQIFLSNGSDEVIDLLVRLVARPGQDSIVSTPPTFGMYEVAAALNDVTLERVPLDAEFQLSSEAIAQILVSKAKIVFLCSPNNPTGNLLRTADIEQVLRGFPGLVVVDEAYADFAEQPSWITRLAEFPNLVVLQTFSKAWGLAGIRLGMAFAAPEIVAYLNRIKMPYNVSENTQRLALAALADTSRFEAMRQELLQGRAWLGAALAALPIVDHIFPSDANFLLTRFRPDAGAVYQHLLSKGIVVRRPSQPSCAGTLRLTVGTPAENDMLVTALREFSS